MTVAGGFESFIDGPEGRNIRTASYLPFSMRLPDSRDNTCVRSATAEISAHPLLDFFIGKFNRSLLSEITGDSAGRASLPLLQHGDRRTNLAGSAVAALKAIVFDEGSLHRVEFAALS